MEPTFFRNSAPWHLKVSLFVIVVAHAVLIAANFVAMFVLPFVTPWYVAVPLITVMINFVFSSLVCPLTTLESVLRKKMGLPEVKFFLQHYLYSHFRRA